MSAEPIEPPMVPLSQREPLPPPPPPLEPVAQVEDAIAVAPRTRSITEPPPMDDVDTGWDDEPADAAPAAPAEPASPTAGELAGDGAVDSDHLDVD
jgi:hypothetical protein